MTEEVERSFQLSLKIKVCVDDIGALERWVGQHVELLPGISYSEEWTDPIDPDEDAEPGPAYIGEVSVYFPTDPEDMLELAAECLTAILPGVAVEDSNWSVE